MSCGSMGLEKVADSMGFMVLNEDGRILSSGGELQGEERIAGVLTSIVSHLVRLQKSDGNPLYFQRLSVVYDSFLYAITISQAKICVVKKTHKCNFVDADAGVEQSAAGIID